MQRVIITGATSMIGVATIKVCISNNVEVVAILRKSSNREYRIPDSDLITKVYADSSEFPDVSYQDGADVLYHFMWEYSHKDGRDNPFLQEKNIELTLRVIEFAKNNNVKKIVFAGSQAEYGPCKGKITEETEPHPNIAYGMAKYSTYMMATKLCQQYGIEIVWTRIFSVYGKNDNSDTMVTTTIDKFLNNEAAFFSSGKQIWNFLYEDDAGRIFYELGRQCVEEGIYNIASKENKPLRQYINEIIANFTNVKYEFESNNARMVFGIEADTSKLFDQIGYLEIIPFQEGIKKIIEFRKNKK